MTRVQHPTHRFRKRFAGVCARRQALGQVAERHHHFVRRGEGEMGWVDELHGLLSRRLTEVAGSVRLFQQVLPEQVLPVVVAVGRAHHRVDVVADGSDGTIHGHQRLVVGLDHDHR